MLSKSDRTPRYDPDTWPENDSAIDEDFPHEIFSSRRLLLGESAKFASLVNVGHLWLCVRTRAVSTLKTRTEEVQVRLSLTADCRQEEKDALFDDAYGLCNVIPLICICSPVQKMQPCERTTLLHKCAHAAMSL